MSKSVEDVLSTLANHLLERTRVLEADPSPHLDGEFVLYWLHHAMRSEENPALDVAIELALSLDRPLVVYQVILDDEPYASDRHHLFTLQGARDLQEQFKRRGTRYVVDIPRRGNRTRQLERLARRAASVVTDEMPVQPYTSMMEALAADIDAPVFCVDTSCIVPMTTVGRAFNRAYEFRDATKKGFESRIHRDWPQTVYSSARPEPQLDFETVDLETCDLGELLGRCTIDHQIGPVGHTSGGSVAGYARWEKFKSEGLQNYHKKRNDPLLNGTSRLSPYLHYGMVSSLRIAREASLIGGPGADKFLDELFVWRELAFAFCFYRKDHDTISAIPDWARASLDEHRKDRRERLLSWETMARARSNDPLWDAAQQSLLRHGELHNNVRMTWGKSILQWTVDGPAALRRMVDLNHRYALDGRDPASYGGILWCLGQFDRPFRPEQPIVGTVRSRSTEEQSQRLSVQRYSEFVQRPSFQSQPKVAIVGAGISGLVCARTLSDHGFDVSVFEKSRGLGGRMATRRSDGALRFDHGCQYFRVRDPRFCRYVESWMEDGIVAAWDGKVGRLAAGTFTAQADAEPRYVGVPTMNSVAKHFAKDLDVRCQTLVQPPDFRDDQWVLRGVDDTELGRFDSVVVAVPAPQAAELLAACPSLAEFARRAKMVPCWALMITFAEPLDAGFDAATVEDDCLAWIARDASKPARNSTLDTWVLHASPEWSRRHLEEESAVVLPLMLNAFWQAIGQQPRLTIHASAHRWRFALAEPSSNTPAFFDRDLCLGCCGDWCSESQVEGAFLSGAAMAGRLLTHYAIPYH